MSRWVWLDGVGYKTQESCGCEMLCWSQGGNRLTPENGNAEIRAMQWTLETKKWETKKWENEKKNEETPRAPRDTTPSLRGRSALVAQQVYTPRTAQSGPTAVTPARCSHYSFFHWTRACVRGNEKFFSGSERGQPLAVRAWALSHSHSHSHSHSLCAAGGGGGGGAGLRLSLSRLGNSQCGCCCGSGW